MTGSGAAAQSLELLAESAGRALACSFSSSDEYEQALIAERRTEGRYRSPHRRRKLMVACAVTAAIVVLALLVV